MAIWELVLVADVRVYEKAIGVDYVVVLSQHMVCISHPLLVLARYSASETDGTRLEDTFRRQPVQVHQNSLRSR